jgi:allantoate deiminase
MEVIDRCRILAEFTEEPRFTTRTFLSEPMHAVHAQLREWMERAGMSVAVDPAGNIRGSYPSARPSAPRLLIGSHLDTVPRAGAFDGVLGVVLGIALVERLGGRRLPFALDVIGFSDEEGVRFGVPFIGSRALIGDIDAPLLATIHDAIAEFGLDSDRIAEAQVNGDFLGYLEFHIEQGPVLDSLGLPLGVVESISGQTRASVVFEGTANHSGTTPMSHRRDALAGAAEWISAVESEARTVEGAVATVGRLDLSPGAANVIPGTATCTLDVRHPRDEVRERLFALLLQSAEHIAARRCLRVSSEQRLDEPTVEMDPALVRLLERAVAGSGHPVHRLSSGAGHDAMILARRMPAAMLFLRSPGGISHHPDETVLPEDVSAALDAGLRFLEELERVNG